MNSPSSNISAYYEAQERARLAREDELHGVWDVLFARPYKLDKLQVCDCTECGAMVKVNQRRRHAKFHGVEVE